MLNRIETDHDVTVSVETQICSAHNLMRILEFDMGGRHSMQMSRREDFWIDLCLTPRPEGLQACYPEHWGAHRYIEVGNLFVVPPGELLSTRWSKPASHNNCGQKSMVCQLNAMELNRWLGKDYVWDCTRLESALAITDRSLTGLLLRLSREIRRPGFASDVMIEAITSQLTIELARFFSSGGLRPVKGGLAAWRLRLIDDRIKTLGKAPTLTELASLCNLSVRQLSRAFQASRQCTLGHYVEQCRLEMAKERLLAGRSVRCVASEMGFSSPSSFAYAFRQSTGFTPSQYQVLA